MFGGIRLSAYPRGSILTKPTTDWFQLENRREFHPKRPTLCLELSFISAIDESYRKYGKHIWQISLQIQL